LALALKESGNAHRVGITGAPGVGKSTLVASLVRALRAAKRTVAILAVDPSSPVSGGALLGDRIRLNDLLMDPGVFFRSSASRGAHGGLSACTGDQLDVLEGAGFDVILIETVGAGQVDVDVASEADTTVVVFAPGAGDSIQAMKSGIMEVADLWIVNKSDDERAPQLRAEIIAALSLGERTHHLDLESEVLLVSAQKDLGIEMLVQKIHAHLIMSEQSGQRKQRLDRRWWRRVLKRSEERLLSVWPEQADATLGTLKALRTGQLAIEAAATDLLRKAAEGVPQ
jgi:LAO/AO transport system kinase